MAAPRYTVTVLTPDVAAALLRVSARRIQQFCKQGRLGQRIGDRWVITPDDLDRFREIPREPGNPLHRKRKRRR